MTVFDATSLRRAVWTRADKSPLGVRPLRALRTPTTRTSSRISPHASWLRINWATVSNGVRISEMVLETRTMHAQMLRDFVLSPLFSRRIRKIEVTHVDINTRRLLCAQDQVHAL